MASSEIESRLALLEREVADLKAKLGESPAEGRPWWDRIAGTFAADPAHDEAMRLGRQYRRSLHPSLAGQRKS